MPSIVRGRGAHRHAAGAVALLPLAKQAARTVPDSAPALQQALEDFAATLG
jgi:hypothetical protein